MYARQAFCELSYVSSPTHYTLFFEPSWKNPWWASAERNTGDVRSLSKTLLPSTELLSMGLPSWPKEPP